MDGLVEEVLIVIISKLKLRQKFVVKVVCRYWYDVVISDLQKQEIVSFGSLDQDIKCLGKSHNVPRHPSSFRLPMTSVTSRLYQRVTLEHLTRIKITRLGSSASWLLHYFMNLPYQPLECLEMSYLDFEVNLPNLKHFSCHGISSKALESVLTSPSLTHLNLNLRIARSSRSRKRKSYNRGLNPYRQQDYYDVFSRLPYGLEYLKVCGSSSLFNAVLSSPAMSTLKTICCEKILSNP